MGLLLFKASIQALQNSFKKLALFYYIFIINLKKLNIISWKNEIFSENVNEKRIFIL